ncbi:ABC transporter ATP-binding protein [Ornithinibacillus halotolerans]|uniref:ABC transporter ATP-binding protein n=1 Tax=Ornithinibacillus halotolerans TaxID=1274357 RepID=A0A916WER3_9BACI|nr:ABC transporter ATP-binding protein [Ornithinibacillus halotolerans]GGA91029.1 ABC transporter ATP-binding protein [Ornithinibacillus halotolerans]
MNNNQTVLSVKKLTKVYQRADKKVEALKDVDFQLFKGEFLAIMGTSGSGKSTLLNILGAMDEPTSGEIDFSGVVDHQNIFKEPYATTYRRENIGFVFQSFHLLKDLTVEENIAMPLILKNVDFATIEEKVNELLELVQLTKWRKHRPLELSGGQQQRVAICRALITSPPLILADEPTGNLDFNTSHSILDIFKEINKSMRQSIVLVTHEPYVASFADRVLFFHDGRIKNEYQCREDSSDMERIMHEFKRILESPL